MPVVSTNLAVNTANVILNQNMDNLEKSLGKVSSGSRIVVASDDAAGLAVSERVSADIAVLAQGARNVMNAKNFLNIVDGALQTTENTLQRFKTLATQAISGAVSDTERGFINAEAAQLFDIILDQAVGEQAFGRNILNGTYNEDFVVGPDPVNDILTVDLTSVTLLPFIFSLVTAPTPPSATNFLNTQANAQSVAGVVDGLLDDVIEYRATVGSLLASAEYRGEYLDVAIENLEATRSSILDVDIASEQTNFVSQQVLVEVSIAGIAQANQATLNLLDIVR